MKKTLYVASLLTLAGCTSSLPVVTTANQDEYLVVARNSAAIFSSLDAAQEEAQSKAISYCLGLGKVYRKKYSVDRPMAVGQVPESQLHFTCVDAGSVVPATPVPTSPNTQGGEIQRLENLNAMLKKGLITPKEYDEKKQEILKAM